MNNDNFQRIELWLVQTLCSIFPFPYHVERSPEFRNRNHTNERGIVVRDNEDIENDEDVEIDE